MKKISGVSVPPNHTLFRIRTWFITKMLPSRSLTWSFLDNNTVWFRKNGICACNGYISKDFLCTLSYKLNSHPLADFFFSPAKFSRDCLEIKSLQYKLSSKKVLLPKSHTCGETTTKKKKSFNETLTSCEAEETFLHSPAKHKRGASLSTVFNCSSNSCR